MVSGVGWLASTFCVATIVGSNNIVKESTYNIDGQSSYHVYDGHGALSAGASSRLLFDYAEPYRSDILDFLFKPNFGASLHHIKVEIGGDTQSTDGTEASHMHDRQDLSCDRGYEFWLLEEARKRNPGIKTYALSWGVPYWVGNQTYYSQDNIDYHVKWLDCARDSWDIGNIDYIGNWNERAWGTPDWTVRFRRAMDEWGYADTKIMIPDGGYDPAILKAFQKNQTFAAALQGGGVGLHYPCDQPARPELFQAGLKYWSSELTYDTFGTYLFIQHAIIGRLRK